MSSIESAPAHMPATRAAILAPALAPLSVGTVNRPLASWCRPASAASSIIGTSPAEPMRFGSSKEADSAERVWETCIYEMPSHRGGTEP